MRDVKISFDVKTELLDASFGVKRLADKNQRRFTLGTAFLNPDDRVRKALLDPGPALLIFDS